MPRVGRRRYDVFEVSSKNQPEERERVVVTEVGVRVVLGLVTVVRLGVCRRVCAGSH